VESTYLSCAETAKLVRSALKKAFPTTKFSVKSSTYSGGASIDVKWRDGPAAVSVEAVTRRYSGGDFDGSIDMMSYNSSWLMPDGTAYFAKSSGTVGSTGCIPASDNAAPSPDAKRVRFGADFIFTNRAFSPELLTRVRDRLAANGYPTEIVTIETSKYDGSGYWTISLCDAEATRGFDMNREMHMASSRTACIKSA
jgi:hypothetical protein